MTSSESKEPKGSERSSTKCRCEHSGAWHPYGNGEACTADGCTCEVFWPRLKKPEPEEEAHVYVSPAHCKACMRAWIGPDAVLEDEPPLTPEEEEVVAAKFEAADAEHLPPPEAICGNCYTDHAQGSCEPSEPPPQPERRPPYVVAYSVQGHLFEVALSGDATVRAVDGALVIQHHLGPIAGIVSVLPIINKESA